MRTLRFTDIKLSLGNAVVLDPFALGDEIESKYDKKCLFCTAQKMKFSIKDSSSKCDQIHRKLRIWSHLLKKSLMENFIFCAVFWVLRSFLTYLLILSFRKMHMRFFRTLF